MELRKVWWTVLVGLTSLPLAACAVDVDADAEQTQESESAALTGCSPSHPEVARLSGSLAGVEVQPFQSTRWSAARSASLCKGDLVRLKRGTPTKRYYCVRNQTFWFVTDDRVSAPSAYCP